MPPMIQKPPPAANAALYDKTQNSGNNRRSFIGKIQELLTAQKGATPNKKAKRPTYGTRQAAKVAGGPVGGGGAAPSPMSIMPGAGAATQ